MINHKDKKYNKEESDRSDNSLIYSDNEYYKYNISSTKNITEELLMNIAKRFHENMSELEIKQLLTSCDFNNDGNIDESDFMKVMKRTKFQ
jgi:Ca2+-binding EF-hand superfamily protein